MMHRDSTGIVQRIEPGAINLMIVNEVSAAELAKMRTEIKPVIEKYSAAYDPAVVSTFKSEVERVQKF